MAATAVPLPSEDPEDNVQAGSEDVVLYFGIIDILQVSCMLCGVLLNALVNALLNVIAMVTKPGNRCVQKNHLKRCVFDCSSMRQCKF